MRRLALRMRLLYARHQLARARARVDELAAAKGALDAEVANAPKPSTPAWETYDRTVSLRAAVAGFDLNLALREASAWHFEVEVLAEELAQPGPVRRALARGARWCERLERGNARLWEGRANAATTATLIADARERAYEHAREADGWAVTAEQLEGTAPSARGIDA